MAQQHALLGIIVLAACAGTEPKATDTVDGFLSQVCSAAAQCPGVTATPAELAGCPADIKSGLSPTQLSLLTTYTGYTNAQRSCVLGCVGTAICGRFGGSITNISDSDVMEPFQDCSLTCGASVVSASLVPSLLAHRAPPPGACGRVRER